MVAEARKIILKDGRAALLRSPLPSDAGEVLEYIKQTSGETYFLMRYPEEVTMTCAEEEIYLLQLSEHPCNFMLAAFIDGKLMGCAGVSQVDSVRKLCHRGHLGISIKKEAWNLGLGSAIVQEALALAGKAGFEQMELAVFSDNPRAKHVYDKLGFRQTGVIPRAYKLKDGTYRDEIQMVYIF